VSDRSHGGHQQVGHQVVAMGDKAVSIPVLVSVTTGGVTEAIGSGLVS
jgi:hypothetical protein